MKKISLFVVMILLISMLCGCGNMSMGMGNYEFNKVHVVTYSYNGCIEVEKWYDSATGIEIATEDFGSMYLAEGMYILIEDDCPFCLVED